MVIANAIKLSDYLTAEHRTSKYSFRDYGVKKHQCSLPGSRAKLFLLSANEDS